MTIKEKRSEIYNFIQDELVNKEPKDWKKGLKKLLIEFANIVKDDLKLQQKESKNKKILDPKPLKTITKKELSIAERKELDAKKGIWRADEFYK